MVSACAGAPAPTGPFQNAVALAATPDGTVWVVDAGESTVVAVRAGVVAARFGGAGTGDGALIDPADVDPTNGQAVFVADRAAGTVVHFTAEGRVAVALVVPDVDPGQLARQPVREGADRAAREPRRGQPVAVAAAPDGALYVVDAGRRHVVRLDAEGAVERVVGASGTGALAEPVDLAVADDGTVWVADAGRGAVQSFDAFGAPGRAVPLADAVGTLRAVSLSGDALVVTGAGGVAVAAPGAASVVDRTDGGRARGAVRVRRPGGGSALVVLTATGLRVVGDAGLD